MNRNLDGKRKRSDAIGSRHRRWLSSFALLVVAGLAFVPALLAVHDTGSFQLDGDADTDDHTVPITPQGTVDWDQVCYQVVQRPVNQGGEGLTAAQALARCSTNVALPGTYTSSSWVAEETPDSTTIFTTGSKDILDLNQWAYKNDGGLPNKDNLLHGYAARYSSATDADDPQNASDTVCLGSPTCEVLYFGSDRYDDEGDATTGVWFFQSKVTLGTNNVGGGKGFVGLHTEGDILVTSEFSNGGVVSTMKIFSWNAHCTGTNKSDGNLPAPFTTADCAEANLLLRAASDAAYCGAVQDGDKFCGLVNPSIITMPWTFSDQDGTGTNMAASGEFFEGGINLSQLGLGGECFQSVVLESRTSAEPNATIKDFILGQLGSCTSGMATTPLVPQGRTASTVVVGDQVSDQVTTLNVSGISTWSGTIKFFICSPTLIDQPGTTADDALQDTCVTGGTQVGNTINVSGNPINPALPITSTAAVTVNATGKWCFRGEFDSNTTGLPDATDASSGECFTVITLQPSLSTLQTWTVKDSATVIVASGAGNLAGNLRFKLYRGADCTGQNGSSLVYDSGDIAVSGALSVTKSTDDATSPSPATGGLTFSDTSATINLKWLVTYTSTNGGHNNVTKSCGSENSTLTIANGSTSTTP